MKDYKRKPVRGINIFLKKKKKKKQQYARQRYKYLQEDGKNKLVEYRKKYYIMRQKLYYNHKKMF